MEFRPQSAFYLSVAEALDQLEAPDASHQADRASTILSDDRKEDGEDAEDRFDVEICRQAFDYYDKDQSGTLDQQELLSLAEVLWSTFNPQIGLSEKMRLAIRARIVSSIVSESEANDGAKISFDEFLPWYHCMHKAFLAQKHRHVGDDQEKAADFAVRMHLVHNVLVQELERPLPNPADVEECCRRILQTARELAATTALRNQTSKVLFCYLQDDQHYHNSIAGILLARPRARANADTVNDERNSGKSQWGANGEVSEGALNALLEAYGYACDSLRRRFISSF
jgi:hypothetical protein